MRERDKVYQMFVGTVQIVVISDCHLHTRPQGPPRECSTSYKKQVTYQVQYTQYTNI